MALPGQPPVFGVPPRPLGPPESLLPAGVLRGTRAVFADLPAEQEIAVALVVDQGAGVGVVKRRVPDVALVNPQVMREEQPDFACLVLRVLDPKPLHEDVLIMQHGLGDAQAYPQAGMVGGAVRHQRVGLVPDPPPPAWVVQPGEHAAFGPDADPASVPADVVGPADVGIVDVADVEVAVEVDQQFPVPEYDVARHGRWVSVSAPQSTRRA